MKRCPFCAEEIQDAAIVCKHCGLNVNLSIAEQRPAERAPNRTAPPTTAKAPTPTTAGAPRAARFIVITMLAIIAGVAASIWLVIAMPTRNLSLGPSQESMLQISGGRGFNGISITNRGIVTLINCRVAVLDGSAEWATGTSTSISPSQTVTFEWSDFRQNNQPLPGYLGRSKNNIAVSCMYNGDRRSAGLHF